MSEHSERLDAQAASYKDPRPEIVLKQLNENWTKVRSLERAVADRDRTIDEQLRKIEARDKLIEKLKKMLTFGHTLTALAYALAAGAAGAGAKEFGSFLMFWLGHHR